MHDSDEIQWQKQDHHYVILPRSSLMIPNTFVIRFSTHQTQQRSFHAASSRGSRSLLFLSASERLLSFSVTLSLMCLRVVECENVQGGALGSANLVKGDL